MLLYRKGLFGMKLKRKLVSLILAAAVALPNMGVNIAAAGEIETAAD